MSGSDDADTQGPKNVSFQIQYLMHRVGHTYNNITDLCLGNLLKVKN